MEKAIVKKPGTLEEGKLVEFINHPKGEQRIFKDVQTYNAILVNGKLVTQIDEINRILFS